MLVFVTALQSPQASRQWPRVAALARRSLRSMLAQDDSDVRVILVCHEPPPLDFQDSRLEILSAPGLPIPATPPQRMQDKWAKLHQGLAQARAYAPCHIMIADADDCVSRRLAGLANRQPDCPGWTMRSGYQWDEGARSIYIHHRRFDHICGTSALIRCEPADLPETVASDPAGCELLAYGHGAISAHRDSIGKPLRVLPFPGAVYITGTGENDSGFSLRNWRSTRILLRKLLFTRPLTRRLREEFGLYALGETDGA